MDLMRRLTLRCRMRIYMRKFERNWTFYEMIEDYYREYPDPIIRILKEKDDEGNED